MTKIILALLSYFQIFAIMFTAVLLFIIPESIAYTQFVLVISSISAIFIAFYFITNNEIRRKIVPRFLLIGILVFLYYLTGQSYGSFSEKYESFFLVLLGQVFPAVLFSCLVASKTEVQDSIKKLAPWISLLFTIVSMYTAFHPSATTTGGFLTSDIGLNYQSNSYLAAYSAGLSLFVILSGNHIKWFFPFDSRFNNIAQYILLLCNFMTILLSGGRGGLVLFFALIIYSFFIAAKLGRITINHLIKYVFVFFSAVLAGYMAFQYVANSTIETSGLDRIISSIRDGDSSGRDALRGLALNKFSSSPIIGHGLGSVFFEMGEYSHNIITDILVECGCVGLFFVLVFLYKVWKKSSLYLFDDISDVFWQIVFLDGLIMSLFSGYYLGTIPLFWYISFVTSKSRKLTSS